jgi:hypothetical protein
MRSNRVRISAALLVGSISVAGAGMAGLRFASAGTGGDHTQACRGAASSSTSGMARAHLSAHRILAELRDLDLRDTQRSEEPLEHESGSEEAAPTADPALTSAAPKCSGDPGGVRRTQLGKVRRGLEGDPPHAPIVINGDADFTAANGVSNPAGCGTPVNPCTIQNWTITPPAGGACVRLTGTTRFYRIFNNSCSGGLEGFSLILAPNGRVQNNSVTGQRGDFPVGIHMIACDNMLVTDNSVLNLQGQNVVRGIATDGGLTGASNVTIARNTVSQLLGLPGSRGTAGSPDGGPGGFGGSVVAIEAGPFGGTNLTLDNNTMSALYGGFGGSGGNAASGSAGDGGTGGDGGSAFGVLTSSWNTIRTQANRITLLFGAVGGSGGSGGSRGGNAGSGGDVEAMMFGGAAGVTNVNNTITQFFGAIGGLGGAAGFGGVGGNGGNGGNAIGIDHDASTGVHNIGNSIANFFAGLGGLGGFPGGVNGMAGIRAAIL